MPLPTDFEANDPEHPESHNATNTVVNQVEADLASHDHDADYAPTHGHPYEAAGAVTAHAGAADPHSGYLTPAEGNAAYAATGHDHDADYDALGAADSAVTTHEESTEFVHIAGAVSYTPSGNLSSTDVESALDELEAEKAAAGHNHTGTYDPAGTAASAVSTHAGAADPHTGYQKESEKGQASGYASLGTDSLVPQDQLGTGTQDGTRFLRDDGTWQAVSAGSHPDLATHDALGLATDAELTAHEGAANPHPTYETSAEAAAKVTAHEAAGDPHTGYRLESAAIVEGDIQDDAVTYAKMQNVSTTDRLLGRDTAGAGNVEEIAPAAARTMLDVPTTGDVTTAVSNHAGAADPHTGYRLESADHTHQSTGLQAGQLDHGASLTGLTDDDHTQYLKEKANGGTAAEVPTHDHSAAGEAGTIAHASTTGRTANDHHNQSHAVTGGDHSHSGGTAGRFLRETGASAFAFESVPFSVGGVILDPTGPRFVMVWRAPFACTVTNVRGHRKGGTGATVNARRNQTSDFLASDLSIGTADAWADGGSVQNTAIAAGDDIEIELASITGAVTEICIQIDLTRP